MPKGHSWNDNGALSGNIELDFRTFSISLGEIYPAIKTRYCDIMGDFPSRLPISVWKKCETAVEVIM